MRLLLGSASLVMLAFPLAAGAATPTPVSSPTVVTVAPITVAGTVALNSGVTTCAGMTYTADVTDMVRETSGAYQAVPEPRRSGTVLPNCTYSFTLPPNANAADHRPIVKVTIGGKIMMPVSISGSVQSAVGANGAVTTLPVIGIQPQP